MKHEETIETEDMVEQTFKEEIQPVSSPYEFVMDSHKNHSTDSNNGDDSSSKIQKEEYLSTGIDNEDSKDYFKQESNFVFLPRGCCNYLTSLSRNQESVLFQRFAE